MTLYWAEKYSEVMEILTVAKAGLKNIQKGEGRFSRNPLTHASNTIEDMKEIATETLKKITEMEAEHAEWYELPKGDK